MDITITRLLFAIIILLLDCIKSEICHTFNCGNLPGNLCANRTSLDTDIVQHYTLQSCGKSQQCPFYNLESNQNLTCMAVSPAMIKLYPGGPCAADSDCLLNQCVNQTCIGTNNQEACQDSKECNYGYSCQASNGSSLCLPQRKEGESCTEDFDCVNTHGCYNTTCVGYFSLPDGHPVEFSPAKYLSLCQSGYEYNNQCMRLTLQDKTQECSDTSPCNYTGYNNTSVVIPSNCLCGYNPSGKKYCRLGSGHKEFIDYISKLSDAIKNTQNCNSEERGVCNYNRKYPDSTFTTNNQKVINARVVSENFHDLINADKCVIDVAFPEYVMAPIPPKPVPNDTIASCAKYACKTKESNCVHSHYDTLANKTMNISVILSDVCNRNEYCDIGGSPNDVFYRGEDVDGHCKNATQRRFSSVRYPGEKCDVNEDCFSPDAKYNETLVGNCMWGRCSGYNETQSCKETAWCWVGNYCSNDGKCAPLKKEKETCNKTTECRNNLLCYQGTCQNVWYSLSVGTNLTAAAADFNPMYYCKFGRATNGVCDSLNTTDKVDLKSNLVACNVGDKCNYTTNNGAATLDCECGYNQDGLSYCPKGNNQEPEKWYSLASSKARRMNNKCHSESRANCYIEDGSLLGAVKDYEHQTESSHLFYNAPSCALRVLSGNFLKFSLIGLVLTLVSLLI